MPDQECSLAEFCFEIPFHQLQSSQKLLTQLFKFPIPWVLADILFGHSTKKNFGTVSSALWKKQDSKRKLSVKEKNIKRQATCKRFTWSEEGTICKIKPNFPVKLLKNLRLTL